MKFTAQVGGLIAGLKPMFLVASKGVQKNYEHENMITLNALSKKLQAIADGGRISGQNEIDNEKYNLDYNCEVDGTVTVSAESFKKTLESFAPSDVATFELVGGDTGNNLCIRSSLDKDESQTLPVLSSPCSFQEVDGKVSSSIKMRRDLFVNYASKITFAHGDSMQFREFQFWVLRTKDSGYLRFAAGSGSIFAIVELEGKALSDAKGEKTIFIPNEQTPVLLAILNELACDTIQIEAGDKFVSISCGNTKVNVYNCDISVKWPNENKFLTRDSKFKFTTKGGSWKLAVKGLLATNVEDKKDDANIHTCSLCVDIGNKFIKAKADSSSKAVRKIAISDVGTNEDDKELSITCASRFLSEIIGRTGDEEFLQFEVENPSMPVVVRHYAAENVADYMNFKKPNDDGFSERYSVFFATSAAS